MKLTFYTFFPSLLAFLSGTFFISILFYINERRIEILRIAMWTFWTFLLFSILGLIAAKSESLISSFFYTLTGSLLLGVLYLILAPITLDWWRRDSLQDVLITSTALFFFGLSGFILIFNIQEAIYTHLLYLFLASTPAFFLPVFFLKSFDLWINIPAKKYLSWAYPLDKPIPKLVPVDTIKVVMNFTPVPAKEKIFEGYEVEYPANVPLGELFHYFISFHNKHREYRKKPIQFVNDQQLPLEWNLYKYSSGKKKIYLNVEKTLTENEIGKDDIIYAASFN